LVATLSRVMSDIGSTHSGSSDEGADINQRRVCAAQTD
jgi:hypothetical protein